MRLQGHLQVVFPAAHVCLRLEQAAAGMWPEAGPVAEDEDAVQDTLLRVSCPFNSITHRV